MNDDIFISRLYTFSEDGGCVINFVARESAKRHMQSQHIKSLAKKIFKNVVLDYSINYLKKYS